MKTEAAQEAYSRRQHFGETPFAVIKCCFDMRRVLLRGQEGVALVLDRIQLKEDNESLACGMRRPPRFERSINKIGKTGESLRKNRGNRAIQSSKTDFSQAINKTARQILASKKKTKQNKTCQHKTNNPLAQSPLTCR